MDASGKNLTVLHGIQIGVQPLVVRCTSILHAEPLCDRVDGFTVAENWWSTYDLRRYAMVHSYMLTAERQGTVTKRCRSKHAKNTYPVASHVLELMFTLPAIPPRSAAKSVAMDRAKSPQHTFIYYGETPVNPGQPTRHRRRIELGYSDSAAHCRLVHRSAKSDKVFNSPLLGPLTFTPALA
jgi:hypothetical protein